MKTKIVLFMLSGLVGVLGSSLRATEPPVLYVTAHTDADIVVSASTDPILQVGSMQQEVLAKIGNPTTKIDRMHWVYTNAWLQGSEGKGLETFDTLIVTFKGQRVSGLYLIKRAALDGYIAAVRNPSKAAEAKPTLLAKDK